MLLHVPEVLSKAEVARVRAAIDAAQWVDGNVTSGAQSALAKRNLQLPEESEAARAAGKIVLDAQWSQAVSRNPFLGVRVKGAKVGDKISVTWVDNKGDKRTDEAAIAAS